MVRLPLLVTLVVFSLSGTINASEALEIGRWSPVPPFRMRAFWNAEAKKPYAKKWIAAAENSVRVKEYPSSDLYMIYYRTGNRYRYETVYSKFREALCSSVAAACLSGQSAHVSEAKRLMRLACAMPSWVLPAHDSNHRVHDGKAMRIELVSSAMGQNMALGAMLLESELEPELRSLIAKTLEDRIIGHFEKMVNGSVGQDWLKGKMNWNPVCMEGVVGTLLAADIGNQRRTNLLSKAIFYSRNYEKGFSSDGYCSEGLAYWSYGFSYYMRMAFKLREISGGKINLMEHPKFRAIADFPNRLMLADDIYPAYGDSDAFARTPRSELALAALLLGNTPVFALKVPPAPSGNLGQMFLDILAAGKKSRGTDMVQERRSLAGFPDSDVYVLRPAPKSSCRLAVSFKGRHNQEEHNHNDVGNYVISVDGGCPVIIDPGFTAYTRKTFSSERYSSRIINSYGHSVPRIDGQLQSAGRNTEALLLEKKIAGDSAEVAYDIRNAYREIPGIIRLKRTFFYSRSDTGRFQVTDEARFKQEKEFETAIITFGTFRMLSDQTLAVTFRGKTLKVIIDTDNIPFEVVKDSFRDDTRYKSVTVTRIAVHLKNKVKSARIRLTFIPM